MKNNLILLTFLILCLSSHAQLEKGKIFLGAAFQHYSSSETNSDTIVSTPLYTNKYKSSIASLRLGYLLNEHWACGILGSYQTIKSSVTQSYILNASYYSKTKENSQFYSGGLFARYYHMIGSSKFAWFGETGASYGMGSAKQEFVDNYGTNTVTTKTHNKRNSLNVYVFPGVTYFLTRYMAVEASIGQVGYTQNTIKNYNDNNQKISERNSSSFNSGFSFSLASMALGINFYL